MSAVDAVDGFRIGDTVWIGAEGDPAHKVTWKVMSIYQAVDDLYYAVLSSGQTGRMQTVLASRLTRFRVLEGAA